ncbi:MAG: HAMP domain-containing histidine kinase [Oscillospiraceae bacterium]|jgi:signal transduction histidine kinase|nr:HAMP domain-containing histidine kinase [Oscillospiraceae bacterium]
MNNKSIAKRLARKMFFRLFWIFISLDVAIGIIAAAGLVVHFEQSVTEAVRIVKRVTDEKEFDRMAYGNVEIIIVPFDNVLPTRFQSVYSSLLPLETREFARQIEVLQGAVIEHVYVPHGGAMFSIRIATYPTDTTIATWAVYVLLGLELLMLIIKSSQNTRLIHRSLAPITELTRAAETLGRAKPESLIPINVGANLDRGDITQLRGALETINAARLDTRLDVGGTQRELRELASAINGMLDRINDAYTAQVRFVSDASHELRTPIAVIQGYANLLNRWGKTDEKTLQESINAIRAEADSMKELVEQLLFLARGENRTITPDIEPFDLAELAEEVAEEARLIDGTHEFRVVSANAPVCADKGLIKQAARVLIDNAIKYTDPGGIIALRTGVKDGSATLSVTDTGIGIEEELLPRIFDRFVRADESRTRASGGAGLGLSIAKWIVTRHGGHLDALSRVGAGTRITIVLPLR